MRQIQDDVLIMLLENGNSPSESFTSQEIAFIRESRSGDEGKTRLVAAPLPSAEDLLSGLDDLK